ncbi:MAG: FecR domain-containing protein [Planctomycetes bacterium]|nr:FecR domain-containing protein [Planctomycetota bacterium]MBL7039115.1 FecR domain-containing protein [Pirellulaceae bacterium]
MASNERDIWLINGYCSGNLSEDEFEELEQRLRQSSEVRQLLVQYRVLESALPSAAACSSAQPATSPRATEDGRRRWRVEVLAIGAMFLLMAGGIALLWSRDSGLIDSDDPRHVAVITQAVGAYDQKNVAIRPGQAVVSGEIALDRGVVRLDFVSGARVAIEGPARLEVIDDMHVVLGHGVVTATVPEAAIGFAVETGTANVVDWGTAFGVSVTEDGTTDVCVFEGQVSVNRKGTVSTNSALVREGQAVRASRQSNTLESTEYRVAAFEKAWPVNSGVLQATGSMKFVSPGPNLDPEKYEDNEHIVIFPEKKNVQLDAATRVGQSDPGEFRLVPFEQTKTIPAGQRVSSYLLQLKSAWTEERQDRKQRVVGQVTFAEPIVGLISRNRLIKETDSLFGNPKLNYETPSRSVEPRPEGDPREGFDKIILAADQRTLILDLQASPNRIDQIRVLVEAP